MGGYLRRLGVSVAVAGLLLTVHASVAYSAEIPAIAGLRPGMTADSVLGLLKAQHIATKTRFKPCLSEYLARHRSLVAAEGPGHCPEIIEASFAGGTLLVFLTEDVPRRDGVAIVTEVALNYPSEEALDRVSRAAGPPTLTDGQDPWTVAMWCFDFVCHDIDRVLATSPPGHWLLIHRGAGLTLADDHSGQMRDANINRALAAHGVRLEH
jgi:hypothetical protein